MSTTSKQRTIKEAALEYANFYGRHHHASVNPDLILAVANDWWNSSKEATYEAPTSAAKIRQVLAPSNRQLHRDSKALLDAVHALLIEFTHTFIVTVGGCDPDQAMDVMAERLEHDEDYGFDYTVNWHT